MPFPASLTSLFSALIRAAASGVIFSLTIVIDLTICLSCIAEYVGYVDVDWRSIVFVALLNALSDDDNDVVVDDDEMDVTVVKFFPFYIFLHQIDWRQNIHVLVN